MSLPTLAPSAVLAHLVGADLIGADEVASAARRERFGAVQVVHLYGDCAALSRLQVADPAAPRLVLRALRSPTATGHTLCHLCGNRPAGATPGGHLDGFAAALPHLEWATRAAHLLEQRPARVPTGPALAEGIRRLLQMLGDDLGPLPADDRLGAHVADLRARLANPKPARRSRSAARPSATATWEATSGHDEGWCWGRVNVRALCPGDGPGDGPGERWDRSWFQMVALGEAPVVAPVVAPVPDRDGIQFLLARLPWRRLRQASEAGEPSAVRVLTWSDANLDDLLVMLRLRPDVVRAEVDDLLAAVACARS